MTSGETGDFFGFDSEIHCLDIGRRRRMDKDKGLRNAAGEPQNCLLQPYPVSDRIENMKPSLANIGKKIIFVYPPELVKQQLLEVLSENEFEVYTIRDEKKVKQIAATYSESIFFFNLDTGLSESMWRQFLLGLKKEIETLQMGLLSFNVSSPDVIQEYVLEYGVNCGFIQLKQGAKVAEDMMLKILNANEAKGRRKYIRYTCRGADQVSLNLKVGGRIIQGNIDDISSVGIGCQILSAQVSLEKNQLVSDIQMRLRGVLVHAAGVVLGMRNMPDGAVKYVILFTENREHRVKQKIRSFIHNALQRQFDAEFMLN